MNEAADKARPLALIGVFIGAAGFAAALTAVYTGMRETMRTSGAFCASGGPYTIAPGHECSTSAVTMLFVGIIAMLVFGGVLLGATGACNGGSTVGAGLLMWAALFGALGFNFIQLGLDPPLASSAVSGWIVSGVVFWLMALGGLVPGLLALRDAFRSERDPAAHAVFKPPIVRANVRFERSMPGDPAFGLSDPAAAAAAGSANPSAVADSDAAAPPRPSAGDFIDPVTGERVSQGDDTR